MGKGVWELVGVRLGRGVTVDRGVTVTVFVGVAVMVGVWLTSGELVLHPLKINNRMHAVSMTVVFAE